MSVLISYSRDSAELAEQFTNGNREHVRDEIWNEKKESGFWTAALLTLDVYKRIQLAGGDALAFRAYINNLEG